MRKTFVTLATAALLLTNAAPALAMQVDKIGKSLLTQPQATTMAHKKLMRRSGATSHLGTKKANWVSRRTLRDGTQFHQGTGK